MSVAQIGAVHGRDFAVKPALEVDAPMHRWPPRIGEGALGRARRGASFCFAERVGAQKANYRFKHALIQDAAYEQPAQEPPPGAAPPRRGTPARRARARRRQSREVDRAIISPKPVSTISRSNVGKAADQELHRSAFQ